MRRCNVNTDPAQEARLVEDFTAAIDSSKPEDFAKIEGMVLDRLERGLSSAAALRLLMHARAVLLGQTGPGLSRVTHAGDLTPMLPLADRRADRPAEPTPEPQASRLPAPERTQVVASVDGGEW